MWSDETYYKGWWVENLFDGEGEFKWNDGRKYSGGWKSNLMHGYG